MDETIDSDINTIIEDVIEISGTEYTKKTLFKKQVLLIVHLVVILIGYLKCCTKRDNVEIPHASHELSRAEDKLWPEIPKHKTI